MGSRESVGAEAVKQGGYDLRVENLTTLEFRKKVAKNRSKDLSKGDQD